MSEDATSGNAASKVSTSEVASSSCEVPALEGPPSSWWAAAPGAPHFWSSSSATSLHTAAAGKLHISIQGEHPHAAYVPAQLTL